MFGKKELNVKKINEVTDLSAKVLKVLYLLLIALALYIVLKIFNETKIIYFLKTLIKIVSPLFIGLVIAWLFDPFVCYLEKKKIKRIWGALITYLLIFLVLFLVLSALIPLLIDEAKEFIRIAPNIFNTVKDWVSDLLDNMGNDNIIDASKMKGELFSSIEKFASNITTAMPKNFLGFITKLFSFIGNIILGFIIGFFLIVNFDSSYKLFDFIPIKHRKLVIDVFDKVNVSLRNYVKGAIIDCTLIFVLSSLGLWMVGLKVPALFGFFCGLTNIIPYAGPYIGGAPAVIVGFTQSPMIGILTLLVIFVIQFLEGNFLQPIIMSKTTKLHPVTIILGLLIFGYFFGIVGMLVSTPAIASVKTIFKYFDEKFNFSLKNKIEISHDED